jgi:hypothetical protein
MLRLSADEANKKYIENLNKLVEKVMSVQNEAKEQPAPPPVENMAPPLAPAATMPA